MSFAKELSKLLNNKYFLYFIVFLSVTNIIGYLATKKINAAIFFGLIGLLTFQFSKNMVIVLLVALIATNILMSRSRMFEGLENQTDAMDKLGDIHPDMKDAADSLNKTGDVTATKTKLEEEKQNKKSEGPTPPSDPSNPDLNKGTNEKEPEGFGEKMTSNSVSKKTKSSGSAPRLDYMSTMEDAYDNLDKMLGSDGIKQLTNDTQKLMQQQQQLFKSMESMVPMLEGAQNMLKGFDMKSLGNLTSLATSLGAAPTVTKK